MSPERGVNIKDEVICRSQLKQEVQVQATTKASGIAFELARSDIIESATKARAVDGCFFVVSPYVLS